MPLICCWLIRFDAVFLALFIDRSMNNRYFKRGKNKKRKKIESLKIKTKIENHDDEPRRLRKERERERRKEKSVFCRRVVFVQKENKLKKF